MAGAADRKPALVDDDEALEEEEVVLDAEDFTPVDLAVCL